MRILVLQLLLLCACACPSRLGPASATAPTSSHAQSNERRPPSPMHGEHAPRSHGHPQHAHPSEGDDRAPLVHRFDRQQANTWAKRFEGPERDRYQQPAKVVAAMALQPQMRVADIGAGTGYFLPHLSKAVGASGEVLAIDIAANMVRYMLARAQREKLANVRVGLALVDDPLLAAKSLDRILLVNTWHHIAQRGTYAKKLLAALKPGGRLVIVDFKLSSKKGPPQKHKLAAEQVVAELRDSGFGGVTNDAVLLTEQYLVAATRPE